MSNVVSLREAHRQEEELFNKIASPLNFTAYERPLYYEGKNGDKFGNTKHKALVRMVDDAPVCLNVVRDTYKVVQNGELFDAVHRGMHSGISSIELAAAEVHDRISYNGAQSFREYRFPSIYVDSPERDKIIFRVIIQNGFGTGAIKMYAGAIDMYCTNGMIIGDYATVYAKHTKGVEIKRFEEMVRAAIDVFWKNRDFYNNLRGKTVKSDTDVELWLEHHFGDRLAVRLFHQYVIEKRTRGTNSLWALYSALTYYASHNSGDFQTRNTGNDHVAATMIKRETDVKRISADIYQLAA